MKWHDIACYHTKPYLCEDSELLLDYVRGTNPELNFDVEAVMHRQEDEEEAEEGPGQQESPFGVFK